MFDLDNYLPYLINRVGVRMSESFSARLTEFGISLGMWRVLAALNHNGDQRLSDLAHLTSIEVSTLSRLVGTMQRKKLVSRARSGQDARAIRVELTREGTELTRRLVPIAQAIERTALKAISAKDAALLRRRLKGMYDNFDRP